MPTQKQYDVTLQPIRQIDCKIAVLDYDYTLLDEISGITTHISLNVTADSDIRRTADVSINLKDDISQNQNHAFYWTAGNAYWFNKYIQIYTSIKDVRTNEDVWVNQGIYCINAPSISYDAITNELSFQAVDLVSKMTGMRNGQLQGATTSVPVESNIKNVIETILIEQGFYSYILYDPPQRTTIEEINIDSGGTAWDLLCQLRDINSNWEMFFDVDGVFHFQEIPNGKVVTSESSAIYEDVLIASNNEDIITNTNQNIIVSTTEPVTYEYGEPLPLVDDTIWKKILISASYDTNFEDVKNYVEIYGKTHEPSEIATATISGGMIRLVLNNDRDNYTNGRWCVEFDIGDGVEPYMLSDYIYFIYVFDKSNTSSPWFSIDIRNDPIVVGNESYCIQFTVGAVPSVVNGEYIGYLQPKAYAIENNPESPFYVGQFTKYTCSLGTNVNFASEKEIVVSDVTASVNNSTMIVDVRPWLSYDDYMNAPLYTEWYFRVHVELTDNIPVTVMAVRVAGTTVTTGIYGLNNQLISLDYSQDYMLIVARNNTANPTVRMEYYPTEASKLPMSGVHKINVPIFNNQVRQVCAGGEYDNIYSNDLAEQRARYEIYLKARLHDNINITCVPIYWLDVNQIIEYRLPNSTSKENDYWLVKSISTDISIDGTQTINAMRYYSEYA